MKKVLSLILVLSSFKLFAQPFEGEIGFTQKTKSETITYRYHIKDEKVRVEEFDGENKLVAFIILNLNTFDAILFNIDRKLYVDLEKNNSQLVKVKGVEIINVDSTKRILGYDCKQVVVKNKKEKKEVIYYNCKDNFSFFKGLLITLNRKDLPSVYFQQIPEINDVFPFLAVEKDADGNVITTFEVTDVVNKKVDRNLFEIPVGYSKL
jgi:hypothetical protein